MKTKKKKKIETVFNSIELKDKENFEGRKKVHKPKLTLKTSWS